MPRSVRRAVPDHAAGIALFAAMSVAVAGSCSRDGTRASSPTPREARIRRYRILERCNGMRFCARYCASSWRNCSFFWADRERAATELKLALAEDPARQRWWSFLAYLLSARKDNEGAVEAFQTALRLDPGDADTRFNYGYLLHQLGRQDEAAGEFREVTRAAPKIDRAWYGLGTHPAGARPVPGSCRDAEGSGAPAIFQSQRGLPPGVRACTSSGSTKKRRPSTSASKRSIPRSRHE